MMALFTGKGDNGTTKTFGCDQRKSKNSEIAEALGSVDEINSFLGFVKINKGAFQEISINGKVKTFEKIISEVQQNLFIVQAELAGAKMQISEEKVKEMELIINTIEKELPPIKTFFVSGGTELASIFDYARTVARHAERRVVSVHEIKDPEITKHTLAYLNRLSSLLYALARLSNHRAKIKEERPEYK